jgi:hypothetical protein
VATAGTCRECQQAFCQDCLVYAFGEGRAPFCVDCALATSGGSSRDRTPFDRAGLPRTSLDRPSFDSAAELG